MRSTTQFMICLLFWIFSVVFYSSFFKIYCYYYFEFCRFSHVFAVLVAFTLFIVCLRLFVLKKILFFFCSIKIAPIKTNKIANRCKKISFKYKARLGLPVFFLSLPYLNCVYCDAKKIRAHYRLHSRIKK